MRDIATYECNFSDHSKIKDKLIKIKEVVLACKEKLGFNNHRQN